MERGAEKKQGKIIDFCFDPVRVCPTAQTVGDADLGVPQVIRKLSGERVFTVCPCGCGFG